MTASIASGIGTALASFLMLSYSQNIAAAGAVGLGGAELTRRLYRSEQENLERRFAALPPFALAAPSAHATATTQITVQAPAQQPIVANHGAKSTASVPISNPSVEAVPVADSFTWSSGSDTIGLPKLDMAAELAKSDFAMVVATQGAGKSTLIRAAIRKRFEWLAQRGEPCQFLIVDPKGNAFLGLEKTEAYCRITKDTADRFLELLSAVYGELERRSELLGKGQRDFTRLTLFVDEWLSIQALLKAWDRANGTKYVQEAAGYLDMLSTQGRELGINIWMVTHSHLCSDLGLSGSMRSIFNVFALGRMEQDGTDLKPLKIDALIAAMQDHNLNKDQSKREALQQALRGHDFSDCLPVVFTPCNGGVLCSLPDYRDYIEWEYPLPKPKSKTLPKPSEVALGDLRGVLERIAQCTAKSQMQTFLDCPKGGASKAWADAVSWYDLVHNLGVEEALDQILATKETAPPEEIGEAA